MLISAILWKNSLESIRFSDPWWSVRTFITSKMLLFVHKIFSSKPNRKVNPRGRSVAIQHPNWIFHDRRFCQIIWQIFTQGRAKKKNHQKLPPVGLKPGPPDLQANALSAELGRNLLSWRFLKWALFVSCTTSHVVISRINRAWLYKGHEDSGWQLNVDLGQLVRHWPHDLEVLVSNPAGGKSLTNLFCSSLCKDLSDNLTEAFIVKNSIAKDRWRERRARIRSEFIWTAGVLISTPDWQYTLKWGNSPSQPEPAQPQRAQPHPLTKNPFKGKIEKTNAYRQTAYIYLIHI